MSRLLVLVLGAVLGSATTAADGTRSESKVTRGDVGWRENTTHTIENAGTTDIHALSIEPKPGSAHGPGRSF